MARRFLSPALPLRLCVAWEAWLLVCTVCGVRGFWRGGSRGGGAACGWQKQRLKLPRCQYLEFDGCLCAATPLHPELQNPLKYHVRHALLPVSIMGMQAPAACAISMHNLMGWVSIPQCGMGEGFSRCCWPLLPPGVHRWRAGCW